MGGTAVHTPCAGGLFAIPGSTSALACIQVVFAVVSLQIPMFVDQFSRIEQDVIKKGLASAAGVMTGYVVLHSLSDVGFKSTRSVFMIATRDAITAALLTIKLDLLLQNTSVFASGGLPTTTLDSITITSCQPGFQLTIKSESLTGSDGICQLCPASY